MAAATTPVPATRPHWKHRQMAKAGAIGDFFEVGLAYGGQLSLFIIFVCLVINIAQSIPHVQMNQTFISVVFGVQMTALDIGGFGLITMAGHVKEMGEPKAARLGKWFAFLIIGLTLTALTVGAIRNTNDLSTHKDTALDTTLDQADFYLLLARAGMSALYGHVVHSIKQALEKHEQKQADLAAEIAQLQQEASDMREKWQAEMTAASQGHAAIVEDLQTQLSMMRQAQEAMATSADGQADLIADLQGRLHTAEGQLHDAQQAYQTEKEQAEGEQARLQAEITAAQKEQEQVTLQLAEVKAQLQDASKSESSLLATMQEKELSLKAEMEAQKLSLEAKMKAQMEAAMKAQQEEMEAELKALQLSNAQLKAKMKAQAEAPVKPSHKVSPEKFDARQFVFSCLRESSDLTLLEIANLAKKKGQELSEPTISRYRKEYRESSNESSRESSAV